MFFETSEHIQTFILSFPIPPLFLSLKQLL